MASEPSLLARTGRHLQRYEDKRRLVSGCIPYRLRNRDGSDQSSCLEELEVVMVSTPNRDDLVFPKGGWEMDETVEEAACREALEEAGVKGKIKAELGDWQFRSKSRENLGCLEGGCKGYMFALEVTEVLDSWPEQESHERKWVGIKDAFRLCRYEWMREALGKFLEFMAREYNIKVERQDENPIVTMATAVVPADCTNNKSTNCFVNPTKLCLQAYSLEGPQMFWHFLEGNCLP